MISSDMNYRVAEVYSEVLFSLAIEQQMIDAVRSDLQSLADFMSAESDFLKVMASPYFSVEEKHELLKKLFEEKVSGLTFNFLRAVISHNRATAIEKIIGKYEKLYRVMHNYHDIYLTVSQALGQAELEAVKASLSTAMKSNKVTVYVSVEPSIIGGAIIRHDSTIIDNSVRTRLHRAVETVITRGKNREKVTL